MMRFIKSLLATMLTLGLLSVPPSHAKPLYTDFTGQWRGTCDDGSSFEIRLRNDHMYFSIEDEQFKIGNMKQTIEDKPEYARVIKTYFNWKNHMSMIEGRTQSIDTRIQNQVLNPPITMLVYQSFSMQGNDLIYVLQEDGAGRRCVLHKAK